MPLDRGALRKWEIGIDDARMLENKKHYVEEIFEVIGSQWNGEKYILPLFEKRKLLETDRIVIGINTGAG